MTPEMLEEHVSQATKPTLHIWVSLKYDGKTVIGKYLQSCYCVNQSGFCVCTGDKVTSNTCITCVLGHFNIVVTFLKEPQALTINYCFPNVNSPQIETSFHKVFRS